MSKLVRCSISSGSPSTQTSTFFLMPNSDLVASAFPVSVLVIMITSSSLLLLLSNSLPVLEGNFPFDVMIVLTPDFAPFEKDRRGYDPLRPVTW
jgi:hypothetical protein